MTYRKLRGLDVVSFTADVSNALERKRQSDHFDDVNAYKEVLSSTLDKHAPVRTRIITLRPHAPWYNDQLRASKQERRRLEHRWRMTGFDTDKEAYKEQRDMYNRLLNETKTHTTPSWLPRNRTILKIFFFFFLHSFMVNRQLPPSQITLLWMNSLIALLIISLTKLKAYA